MNTTSVRRLPMLLLAVAGAFAAVVGAPRAAQATPEGDGARADIQKTFGFVPQFLSRLPDACSDASHAPHSKRLELSTFSVMSS